MTARAPAFDAGATAERSRRRHRPRRVRRVGASRSALVLNVARLLPGVPRRARRATLTPHPRPPPCVAVRIGLEPPTLIEKRKEQSHGSYHHHVRRIPRDGVSGTGYLAAARRRRVPSRRDRHPGVVGARRPHQGRRRPLCARRLRRAGARPLPRRVRDGAGRGPQARDGDEPRAGLERSRRCRRATCCRCRRSRRRRSAASASAWAAA